LRHGATVASVAEAATRLLQMTQSLIKFIPRSATSMSLCAWSWAWGEEEDMSAVVAVAVAAAAAIFQTFYFVLPNIGRQRW
jgi:hypothetical protein